MQLEESWSSNTSFQLVNSSISDFSDKIQRPMGNAARLSAQMSRLRLQFSIKTMSTNRSRAETSSISPATTGKPHQWQDARRQSERRERTSRFDRGEQLGSRIIDLPRSQPVQSIRLHRHCPPLRQGREKRTPTSKSLSSSNFNVAKEWDGPQRREGKS